MSLEVFDSNVPKGSRKDVCEIARELGGRYVVEGSVCRVGQRLRPKGYMCNAIAAEYRVVAAAATAWRKR